MAWTGTGSYVLNALYYPEVNGTIIDAVRYNGLLADVQGGITAALAKNGENVPTANLPMGGFKHTGVASAVGAGQYIAWGQNCTLGALTLTGDISGVSAAFTENVLPAKVIVTTDGMAGNAVYGFSSESGLGMYRVASNKLGFQVVGTKRVEVNTSGVDITGTLGVSGTVTAPTFSGALSGNATTATSVSNALTFSNAGSGAASGTTYNGSTARTISYNSIGAAASTHTHAISDVTGLQTALDGKAASSHTHTMANVTDLPTLASGIWTPTVTSVSNVASIGSTSDGYYIRVGAIVFASVSVSVTATSSAVTAVNMTVPIASNFGLGDDEVAIGIAAWQQGTSNVPQAGRCTTNTTSDTVNVYFNANSTSAGNLTVSLMYRIL